MNVQINLQQYARGRMIGMRSSAAPIRKLLEQGIAAGEEVLIDFSGVEVTQSFVDELLGAVIRRYGVEIMRHILLKGCSANTRGVISFVIADRAKQYAAQYHSNPATYSFNASQSVTA